MKLLQALRNETTRENNWIVDHMPCTMCTVPRMNLNKITMGYMPVETCDLDFFQNRLETKVADLNNYSSYAPPTQILALEGVQ